MMWSLCLMRNRWGAVFGFEGGGRTGFCLCSWGRASILAAWVYTVSVYVGAQVGCKRMGGGGSTVSLIRG